MRRLALSAVCGLIAAATWRSGGSAAAIAAACAIGFAAAAHLLGDATEDLAAHAGPRWGGLITAVLGNAAELVLVVLALQAGLLELVKAGLIGSILGNVLVILGLGAFLGGLRHGTQYFNREAAGIAATMMVLSLVALGVPALYGQLVPLRNTGPVESLSAAVAAVMICVYLLSMHYSLFWNLDEQAIAGVHRDQARRRLVPNLARAAAGLVAATLLARVLVNHAPAAMAALGLTPLFAGLVVVPLIGTVPEHFQAVGTAWRNRMDLSVAIAMGASMRVAMLVAPMLVFLSLLLGQPMDLIFQTVELVALAAAAGVAALVAVDGQSNWIEGVMLLAVFLLLSLAFLWWPAVPGAPPPGADWPIGPSFG